ncbi:hypothetical protein [Lentzea sp. NEAU-D7]|uniref:hypothetical protein n=1 Tax=Lentzea sp. NEAU-D7 TaxID=2994667 RepID=UPI00224A8EC4|nr:hypothetical protein [Lentzea sp. NEAU-D7]MCX2947135.1 hypothetical protein [Lentzea sp. NEAU-D7]
MNPLTPICLLVAAALTACGQPPPPRAPQPEVTPTSTTAATTSTGVVAPTTTSTTVLVVPTTRTNAPPKPPRTTTTTKPPPPPPKPPDRWVLPAGLRGSIEQQDEQFFPESWGRIQGQVAEACPGQVLCVGHALVVDPASGLTEDCFVVPGGISVPDPLHEGGTITFRVTNDLCSGG